MMSINAIAPKLIKLIPMLSSESDGEAVAAVRAIDRTLKAAKLDWHDLAKALSTGGAGPQSSWSYEDMARRYAQAEAARRQREEATRQASEAEARRAAKSGKNKEKLEAIEWCLEQARISVREREFLESVKAQIIKGSDLSDKQKKWLIDIYDRLKRGR